jgi:hypothetical protein
MNDREEGHDEVLGNDHGNDQNRNQENDRTENLGDTSHHDDTTSTTLETSIELVKRNRPLLDRMGKFVKVLENLLKIGTAVSEVSSPSSLSVIQVSNCRLDKIHPVAKAVLASINVIYGASYLRFMLARFAHITLDS